ncbi:hypothetical protein TRAPUB_1854, partial [Trametes pubescens]
NGQNTSSYAPVYVTPLLSIKHPATPGSQTAMYATAILPRIPLQIGDRVHLYLRCLPCRRGEGLCENQYEPVAVPLEIWGKISGERERNELEVEYVVRNDNEDAHVRRVFLRTRADFCECSTPTSPADEQALRLSDARDEWEERTARKLRQERVASETGPVTMRARGSDRGRDMALKTLPFGPLPSSGQEITGAERRSERGRRREPSDDGCRKKWPVAQGEEGRPGLKGAERRRRVEAPGPSKRIYPLWLAPNERSRGRKGAGVGRKADRSPGALA